ncbi:MAG: GNAT family N-acetyltransferase [Oscillospiraceae bacterium]|nr:GNAT family N-acetyltransferase [Oscillospiraceae bacterium]
MNIVLCGDRDWLLSEEAYMLYAPCMYQPAYDDFKIQMEDLLNDQSVRVYVCENRGKKTGMMVLKFSDSGAEIIGIAVPEKFRRRGIGRHLIQFAMESEDVKWIEAQTDDDSVGFYRKCGFTEERIVVDYPDGSVVRYNCVLCK